MPFRLFAALAAVLALAGCQTPGAAPAIVVSTGCPDVVTHDAEWQKTVATAVVALPPTSPLRTVTKEWAVGRNQARACRGGK